MVWMATQQLAIIGKRRRIWGAAFLCWVLLMLVTPKIPHSPKHHLYADMRNLLGVPNTLNVITTFPFLVVGVLGFVLCVQGGFFNISLPGEVWGWALFYAGTAGVAFGSAYYHMKPADSRVAWDTLPVNSELQMMIAYSSLFSSFIVERLGGRIGLSCLFALLFCCALSFVLSPLWSCVKHLMEVVHDVPVDSVYSNSNNVICVPTKIYSLKILALGHSIEAILSSVKNKSKFFTGVYLLSKFESVADKKIYRANHFIISGHSLEHLCLVMVPVLLSIMLMNRKIKCQRCDSFHHPPIFLVPPFSFPSHPSHSSIFFPLQNLTISTPIQTLSLKSNSNPFLAMTDRVYPSSKPNANGGAAAAPAAPAAATSAGTTANPPSTKPQLRQPYRPKPQYHNRRHRRSSRNLCCCCCFWSFLILIALALLAAIAGAAVYILYRPHRPEFTLTSVRIAKLNLTTTADFSTSHLATLFNLTLTSENPNNHLTFSYDPFTLLLSTTRDVQIANGSIPAFTSATKNSTFFRSVLSTSQDLDVESVKSLRSDLRKQSGVALKLQIDTEVKLSMGKLRSKKVGIRVTCEGIKGVVPKGKTPSVASVSNSKCNVDLRIKIWKWTF
ncbi:unnamed protein product [Malus baccata var. baccata]